MLVRSLENKGLIGQVRDEEFYAWRFKNPFSIYRYLFWEKAGFQGFVVLQQPVRNPSGAALIVDWETTSNDVLSDILQTVIRWGGLRSISVWSTTLSLDMATVLAKYGFHFPVEGGDTGAAVFYSPIVVFPLGNLWSIGGRDILDVSNWDLRPIYSDNY